MKIKKLKDSEGQIMDDDRIKGVRFHPMLTASDGAPNFAMRLFEIGPDGHTPLHEHDWEHEVYIVSGNGFVIGGKEKVTIEEGDFILVPPSEIHQFRAGRDGMSIICVVPNRGQPS